LLTLGLYPVLSSVPVRRKHKLPTSIWPDVLHRHKSESLRQLAREYGISHEAVRRMLVAAANDRTGISR